MSINLKVILPTDGQFSRRRFIVENELGKHQQKDKQIQNQQKDEQIKNQQKDEQIQHRERFDPYLEITPDLYLALKQLCTFESQINQLISPLKQNYLYQDYFFNHLE